MGMPLFAGSFAVGIITTFLVLRKISIGGRESKGGIFILSEGKYLRVHHWQLGVMMMLMALLCAMVSVFPFLGFMFLIAQFMGGMGLGVFVTDMQDFVESREWY